MCAADEEAALASARVGRGGGEGLPAGASGSAGGGGQSTSDGVGVEGEGGGGWSAMGWVQEWCLSIGISLECMPLIGKQPGWDSSSAAVHSDDGRFYFDNCHKAHDLKFGPGDTIGTYH